MVNGSAPQAAAICRAETYWLERPASMTTLFVEKAAGIDGDRRAAGGRLDGDAERLQRVDQRPIGRLRICSSPSTT
jgi:hypothetical protein